MATYTYHVITDTHGYPWGSNYAADFDLGDNTSSYHKVSGTTFQEAPHLYGNPYIRLLGNHDASYYRYRGESVSTIIARYPNMVFKPYTISGRINEKIAFFGINTVEDVDDFTIPSSEISGLAANLETLPNGTDIVILTHVPLFKPITDRNTSQESTGESYDEDEYNKWHDWDGEAEEIIKMLQSYQNHSTYSYNGKEYNFNNNGNVIGCFCGHIHNHVQCYYKGIYMESFGTNGENEWTASGNNKNCGLYTPPIYTISIDLTNHKVNTYSYTNTVNNGDTYILDIENRNSGESLGNSATGTGSLGGYYPKFYQRRYVGYSSSSSTGVSETNHLNGWFTLEDNTYIQGLQHSAKYIHFDASGRLRYYKDSGQGNDINNWVEIPNYTSRSLTFSSDNRLWKFVDGLFSSCQAIFKSGTMYGKNNYSIVFDQNGFAQQINLSGVKQNYTKGNNWINVYEFRVFWRPFTDYSNAEWTTNTPQIGILGTFNSDHSKNRINLGRATTSGSNWIENRYNILIRIIGENNQIYWLYDGRLTNLTDSQLGISL